MPNHIHFINKPYGKYTISDNIQNFASYTAHEILKLLRKDGKEGLIDFFHQEALALQAKTPGGARGEVETSLPSGCRPARRTGKAGGKQIGWEVNECKYASEKSKINMVHETRHLPRSSTRPRVRGATNHKIWQDIQAKNIYSLGVLEQKIKYTHSNPCNKKWSLVKDGADYKYSSACFYDKGIKPIIEVDDVRKLFK